MEEIGDYYVTNDKILDAWHCPLGVDFGQAVGEMGTSCLHALFATHVLVKHRYVLKVFRVLVVRLRCTISRMCSCSCFVYVPFQMKLEHWEAYRIHAMY